jgi:hypothetical protein
MHSASSTTTLLVAFTWNPAAIPSRPDLQAAADTCRDAWVERGLSGTLALDAASLAAIRPKPTLTGPGWQYGLRFDSDWSRAGSQRAALCESLTLAAPGAPTALFVPHLGSVPDMADLLAKRGMTAVCTEPTRRGVPPNRWWHRLRSAAPSGATTPEPLRYGVWRFPTAGIDLSDAPRFVGTLGQRRASPARTVAWLIDVSSEASHPQRLKAALLRLAAQVEGQCVRGVVNVSTTKRWLDDWRQARKLPSAHSILRARAA